jgi:cardiolipin synthase
MVATLPNALTFGRILAIPLLIGLFFVDAAWGPWAALAVYVVAAVTDYFDGLLARVQKTASPLGKLMDPIADKMLVAATLFLLVAFGRLEQLAIIPAIVILLREILISGLREFLAGMAARGLPVSSLAKWKTGVQMTAIGFLIVGDAGPDPIPVILIGEIGLWIAAVLTIVTGWAYVREGVRQVVALTGHGDRPRAEGAR